MGFAADSNLPHSFITFGDLLKYLRRRARLTQLELSIAVGYSEAQISRLEKNQRLPDLTAIKALFIPALHLEEGDPLTVRFLELAQSTRQEDAPAPGIAPYMGLLFFGESDSELFFGREAITARLTEHVLDLAMDSSLRFLAVVGASGSGKSSLVRAGLAVALQRVGWDTHVFTPTTNPLKILEANLNAARAKNGERVLLLVDQFEEVFTLCHDEMERIGFIEKLISLAGDPSKKITVVIALRADFYSHCAQYPLLRGAVAAEQEYMGQMTTEELRRAIEEPARRAGWQFEPGLVDMLLNDIGAQGTGEPEPGALPLLSHALLATWERRRGRTFTLDGYRDSGGVRGAIAETAESVYTDQLNQTQQELACDIFLRLTELGEGTEDTRRRAALNELVRQPAEAPQLRAVLNILAEARLITLNEDSAEVAHEALIREWRRLHEWLTQDREGLLLHRHLTEAAHEWEARGRDPSELYRGVRLAQAREWASLHQEEMNALESQFLAASVESNEREIQDREAQRQRELETARKMAEAERARAEEQALSAHRLKLRNRLVTTIGMIACVLAVLAGVFGWASYRNELRAEREQRTSAARELASASLTTLSTNPELGTLLALQAIASTKSKDGVVMPEAIDALYRAISTPHAQLTLRGQGAMDRITYSPDGELLAAYDSSGVRRIWNANTGQELFSLPAIAGTSLDLAFTKDGKTLVASDLDDKGLVAVSFWDFKSGQLVSTTPLDVDPGTARLSWDKLNTDGTRLALANEAGETTLWNTSTGKQLMKFSQSNAVFAVAFSRDSTRIATADRNEVKVWDVASGEEVMTFSKPNQLISSIDFSPDGTRLAASNHYSLIWVWDLQSGEELYTLYGHTNTVNSVHFNADGTRIASASNDRKVFIWDAISGVQLLSLAGHTNTAWDSAFSPDGKHIATASEDHTVKIWDLSSGGELPSMNTGALITIFDPEQERLALSFSDRPAEIWDFPRKKRLFSLSDHSISWVYKFSADGKRLASKSPDGTVSLWDATSGQELWVAPASPIGMVIPSPDGNRVAIAFDTGNAPGVAQIWDTGSNQLLLSLSGHKAGVWGLAYSPDGKHIATGDNAGVVKVWDAETGKELFTLEHSPGSKIRALVFSRDGKYLATGSQNGLGKIWDSRTGKLVLTLVGHTSTLKDFAFSPDSTQIATAGYDGTLRVWDAHSGTQVQTLYGDGGGFWTLAYTPNGKRLVAATDSGTIRTYLLDINELIALARAGLTRTLSRQECQQYLHVVQCPADH
jgi:WD40 repeat protein/transcriptional regulator with XRE-family HTH domain